MSGDDTSSATSPSRGGLHLPTSSSPDRGPVPKKSPMFVRRGAPPIAPGQDDEDDSPNSPVGPIGSDAEAIVMGELSSSNQDSERTGGTVGNLPTEDVPFPGLYDKAFRCLDQKSLPRLWCIQLICWPYPFTAIFVYGY